MSRSSSSLVRVVGVGLLGSAAALLAAIGSVVGAACIAIAPVTVVKDSGFIADGGCTTCLYEPDKCAAEIAVCSSDPPCDRVLRCVENLKCFDKPSVDDKVNCGLPCAVNEGVTSVTDPRIERLLNVLKCGQTKCAVACNLGDGGTRFDAF